STMGGPLLKMLWGRSTGVMEEFWLKGYWIQMMGFGTPSEIKLTLDSIEYYVEPTTTTEPVSTTTTTTTTTTTEGRTPGFEFPIFLMAFVTVSIMFTRRRKP
ncbi:MAG: Heimdall-CTERM domain-containing surface protein, partial [Candidatus Hodarchaeota archaeon]